MPEPRSAEIIYLPRPVPTTERSPPQGLERLSKAMDALGVALAAQRHAVAEWRVALADLQGAVRGKDESMQAYHRGLDALGAGVAGLRAESERLVRWPDGAGEAIGSSHP